MLPLPSIISNSISSFSSNLTSSPDFSAIHAKLISKNIRIRGLKVAAVADLGSDSDDEDFDVNSAQEDAVEDGDYHHKDGEDDDDDDDDMETSDTDEVMKELEPESDMMDEDEDMSEKKNDRERPGRKDEDENPSVRNKHLIVICRRDRRWRSNAKVFVFDFLFAYLTQHLLYPTKLRMALKERSIELDWGELSWLP